jgi:hypothetical protein
MKRHFIGSFLIYALLLTQPLANADSVALPANNSSWLEILNYYRQSSGLSPVIEDLQMTDGAQKHANYLSKTSTKYFVGEYANLHTENSNSPFYTEEGTKFGTGNIAWGSTSFPRPIDRLMTAPFHAIGFLREGLTKVGFGTAVVQPSGYLPGMQVTNVAILAGTENLTRTKNILFPGANSEVYINDFTGENPEPREVCGSNYKSFTGLPIFASLLATPTSDLSVELTTPSGKVLKNKSDVCVVTEINFKSSDPIYGAAGRGIIAADHLVLIIPKQPLAEGLHKVSILQGGLDTVAWSFRYRDSIVKVENKVTISYPRANKVLYSGDIVKINVMNTESGVTSQISGVGTTCNGKWVGSTLIVTGKNHGSCTVKVFGKSTKNTKSFTKSFVLKYESKKF